MLVLTSRAVCFAITALILGDAERVYGPVPLAFKLSAKAGVLVTILLVTSRHKKLQKGLVFRITHI